MSDDKDGRLERLSGMLKRRGFLLPAFEIHGGAKGLYDFGGCPLALTGSFGAGQNEHKTISMYVDSQASCCGGLRPESVCAPSGH